MTHTEQRGTLQRMDNIAIVVDDLAAAKAFFTELGMELEGEATLEGSLVDRLIRLDGVRTDIAMMRAPDGSGRIELTKYHTPASPGGDQPAPVNALGMHRIMFAVHDIEDVIDRLKPHGAELVGEVVRYEDIHRLAYLRGPAGIIVALAEQIG
ncbi:VOC family protein [Actinomadura vinacea]|uniref:VOC family protein n=2 Tax=Actinomadura vinacea TaxID=115336 RepID=A0ABP5VL08_9ACTN